MEIKINCPQCGAHYSLGEELLGRKVECAECGTKFFIGEDGKPEAAPEAAAAIAASAGPLERTDEAHGLAENEVPAVWEIGDVILDLYEVTGVLGEGGMGKVYKVRHRGWNVDLAVKSPKPEIFSQAGGAENFERECEAWIDLGLHPHTVSCYYVRRLGGIPRVFAEYVDGGTLHEWIRDRRLYEGGLEKALERMLDIAIQFAWGLHYAHERGLIHQDVKPANVMMTADGLAKVTDFGLARARVVAGDTSVMDSQQSILMSMGGMTPAYCSPEQAKGEKLTRRTDIWSWGLSVLEMFTGGVTWRSGTLALAALENFLDNGTDDEAIPRMPKDLVELLRHCFRDDPDERPKDMMEVAGVLKTISQNVTGRSYPRSEPQAAKLTAASLNNHAVSLIDLGNEERALRALERALEADPKHCEATYNRGLILWRSARVTDVEMIALLEEIRRLNPGSWKALYASGLVDLECADFSSAIGSLEEAAKRCETPEIHNALSDARKWSCYEAKCMRTFQGHSDSVASVCMSANAQRALSGSWDKTLRYWDVTTGKCMRTFQGHSDSITSVSLSANARRALSGSWDKTLRYWDLPTGKCLRIFHGHTNWVSSVCLSGDVRWAFSGSLDKTLRLWDIATGKCLRTFEGHTGEVNSVYLSDDNCWALSGGVDSTLRLWDVATGQCLRTFKGHTSSIESVCLSADGRWALSGSRDRTLRLWDVATGQCLRVFRGHAEGVNSVYLSGDARWALSGGEDKTVRLWDVATGQCLRTFQGHAEEVNSVFLSAEARFALSGGRDRTLRLWDLQALTEHVPTRRAPHLLSDIVSAQSAVNTQSAFEGFIRAAKSTLSRGDWSAALTHAKNARAVPGYEAAPEALESWNQAGLRNLRGRFRGGWILRIFEGHTAGVNSVCLSADGRWALSGGDTTLRFWDVATGQCLRTFEGHTKGVTSVCLSADARSALSGSLDGTLRLWNVATGQCEKKSKYVGSINCVSLSADSRWALAGSWDKNPHLWDLTKDYPVETFQCDKEGKHPPGLLTFASPTAYLPDKFIYSVCLSADASRALSGESGESGGTLRLWEVASGQCLRTFEGQEGAIISLYLSADARWALSGGKDRTMRLWDVATGKCIRSFSGHSGGVSSVCLSSDTRWALSGDKDSTSLWDVATGKCIRSFSGHTGGVSSVCLSADARWALSGHGDGRLRLWELDWEFEPRQPADWDNGALRHLQSFLAAHTPYASQMPAESKCHFTLRASLTRLGKPSWTAEDFKQFLHTLACAGYGWLRPDGVRRELKKMAADWQGPPPLVV